MHGVEGPTDRVYPHGMKTSPFGLLAPTTFLALGMSWAACSIAGSPSPASPQGGGAAPATDAPAPAAPGADAAAAPVAASAFLPAARCAVCHSQSPNARALTTPLGDDASPHGLWKATPMANSFRDPYWRAQVAREVEAAPGDRAQIEQLCTTCHAPAEHHDARLAGVPTPSIAELASSPLANDGVTCTVCHQAQPSNLGTAASFAGHLDIRPDKVIYGPYSEPATGPMRMHTGYTPTFGKHVRGSALCGSCHTLHTTPAPGAKPFLEQAPYLEWRNSDFSDESGATETSRTCQECHMPDMGDMRIARMPPGTDFNIAVRPDVRGHAFVGGNALLLDILRANSLALGIQVPAAAFERMAAATRAQLAHETGKIAVQDARREGGRLVFDVEVENLTGHKLPSGYPSRRAWLAVEVRQGRTRLFGSGLPDERGRITKVADELALPHYDRIEGEDQVQVYEMLANDLDGRRTTSLTRMAAPAKDTRLLPRGWKADGPHADETRPVGVDGDDDFVDGRDTVTYSVALPEGATGRLTIVARLYYQAIPPAWVDALRPSKTDEAASFVAMYDKADVGPETIALTVETVD